MSRALRRRRNTTTRANKEAYAILGGALGAVIGYGFHRLREDRSTFAWPVVAGSAVGLAVGALTARSL